MGAGEGGYVMLMAGHFRARAELKVRSLNNTVDILNNEKKVNRANFSGDIDTDTKP